jgi:hypothetical protein
MLLLGDVQSLEERHESKKATSSFAAGHIACPTAMTTPIELSDFNKLFRVL